MISEWMKVMLDEIERKRLDEQQAALEEKRRADEPLQQEPQKNATS